MTTILCGQEAHEATPARGDGPGLWLSAADLERVTGFALKPEGLCRDALCVPVRRTGPAIVDASGLVDVAAFWHHLGHPVVHDAARSTWVLGTGTTGTASADATGAAGTAPDFALPDLDGRLHRLSEHRGSKVFLATWASW